MSRIDVAHTPCCIESTSPFTKRTRAVRDEKVGRGASKCLVRKNAQRSANGLPPDEAKHGATTDSRHMLRRSSNDIARGNKLWSKPIPLHCIMVYRFMMTF